MATTKKGGTLKKPGGKKPPNGKAASRRKDERIRSATVWVDRWAIDPITGERFRLILHRLPGKGKIDPKVIREAVIKVRDERLAREQAAKSE
jgi:hypothetical protein